MGATEKKKKSKKITKKACKLCETAKNITVAKRSMEKEKKRKKYSQRAVYLALKAVSEGTSLRKAANTFGVPSATLCRKRKNPDKVNTRTGPPTILTAAEEEDIVKWILYKSQTGSPVTKTEVLDCVGTYLKKSKKKTSLKNDRPGRRWFEGFRKRHPHLLMRKAEHLSLVRASVIGEELREWFHEVQTYLVNKDLLNIHPSQIFNYAEINIPLNPKPQNVLTEEGACSTSKDVNGNKKESFTTLFMCNAEGALTPPTVVYSYKGMIPQKIIENFPGDWGIGTSETGCSTVETFFEYMANIFYPWLLKAKINFPVIIYIDRRSSHLSIPVVQFCREKNIELITLYPNSSYIIQPLDTAIFKPFKHVWANVVRAWKIENNVTKLKKEQLPLALKIALDSLTDSEKAIINGFETAGLMPFNANVTEYNFSFKKGKPAKENEPVADSHKANNKQILNDTATDEQKRHLEIFEQYLSTELLKEFKEASINQLWTGNIENKGLFEYWLKLKKELPGIII